MDLATFDADKLRVTLVGVALEWERRYGVGPAITSAISEYDAARLIGHTPESLGLDGMGRTAVTRGFDFRHAGVRYQVKACRPSGKPGSAITKVPKASNYDWDRLIWILYDRYYQLLEAWEWESAAYKTSFQTVERINPAMMRSGRPLHSIGSPYSAAPLRGTLELPDPQLDGSRLEISSRVLDSSPL